MLKKTFLLLLFSFPVLANGQKFHSYSPHEDDFIENYKQLSPQQLFETANYYYRKNNIDTALLYYSLLINTSVKGADIEHQKMVVMAYNNSGVLYNQISNYHGAYELLIKALLLCEEHAIDKKQKIYTNIGNIYYRFNEYELAKFYNVKALNVCEDSIVMAAILSNIGFIELKNEKIDSATYFLNKALQVSKQHNNVFLDGILDNIALFHQKAKNYDTAFYYFRLSLNEAENNNKIGNTSEILSNLSKLYFEVNKMDSALFYINLSNTIARENNFLAVLVENYLTLSKIEDSKGHVISAFKRFKEYVNLKDSVFNVGRFSEINQLQRLYEVTKTNQQIEQLAIEQQIKERTIYYQKVIHFILLIILLTVSGVLLFIYFQKRKLNKAYKVLFEKNIEIIKLEGNTPKKQINSTLSDNLQRELLDKILALMEDTAVICDSEFSIDKLAELVQSNQKYVSQVINSVLKKNFRSFLNNYRIREAQRLFADPDAVKYTIEFVAVTVGFKSRHAFRDAFKEATGVTPLFYLKSMRKKA